MKKLIKLADCSACRALICGGGGDWWSWTPLLSSSSSFVKANLSVFSGTLVSTSSFCASSPFAKARSVFRGLEIPGSQLVSHCRLPSMARSPAGLTTLLRVRGLNIGVPSVFADRPKGVCPKEAALILKGEDWKKLLRDMPLFSGSVEGHMFFSGAGIRHLPGVFPSRHPAKEQGPNWHSCAQKEVNHGHGSCMFMYF